MKKKLFFVMTFLLVHFVAFGEITPAESGAGYWGMTYILVFIISSLIALVYLIEIFPKQISKLINRIKIEILSTLPEEFLGY